MVYSRLSGLVDQRLDDTDGNRTVHSVTASVRLQRAALLQLNRS